MDQNKFEGKYEDVEIKEINKTSFTIKDLPLEDRPQEKLLKFGPDSLSNAELLALIIRTGTRSKTSVELSQDILNSFLPDYKEEGLSVLKRKKLNDFTKINGIGNSKAAMIMAAITLAKRINNSNVFAKTRIQSPKIMYEIVKDEMSNLEVEEFRVVILDTKKQIININTISRGTLDLTVVHPREVFKTAIDNMAHSILLLHNHPSGDPNASRQDIELTKRLVEASKIIGINIVDHIIIGNNSYFSFLERDLI